MTDALQCLSLKRGAQPLRGGLRGAHAGTVQGRTPAGDGTCPWPHSVLCAPFPVLPTGLCPLC